MKNKNQFIGNFENDLPNGHGLEKLNDGEIYKGNFEKG